MYLTFDPLLRESPKKPAGPAAQMHVAAPAAFASRYDARLFSFSLIAAVTGYCSRIFSALDVL